VQSGRVYLWRIDLSGRPVLLQAFHRPNMGRPTAAAFLSYPGAALAAAAVAATVGDDGSAAAGKKGKGGKGAKAAKRLGQLVATFPPAGASAGADGSAGGHSTTAFVMGGETGVISYANDLGMCFEVLGNLHAAVDVLAFNPVLSFDPREQTPATIASIAAAAAASGADPASASGASSQHASSGGYGGVDSGVGRLFIGTRNHIVSVLDIDLKAGKIFTLFRAKIASAATAVNSVVKSGVRTGVWAAEGCFVTAGLGMDDRAAGELRCWDLSSAAMSAVLASLSATAAGSGATADANFVLPRSSVLELPVAGRVTALAFDAAKGLLYAGTDSGHIHIWHRFVERSRTEEDGEEAKHTEGQGLPSASELAPAQGQAAAGGEAAEAVKPHRAPLLTSSWVFKETVAASAARCPVVALEMGRGRGLNASAQSLNRAFASAAARVCCARLGPAPAPAAGAEGGAGAGEVLLVAQCPLTAKATAACDVALVQRTPFSLVAEQRPGAPMSQQGPPRRFALRFATPIRAVDATSTHLAVWTAAAASTPSGSDGATPQGGAFTKADLVESVRIYAFPAYSASAQAEGDEATGAAEEGPAAALLPVATFPVHSARSIQIPLAMALSGDSVFVSSCGYDSTGSGTGITIFNFQGNAKGVLPFGESEGVPYVLDTNGRYLAVGTDSGDIRLYDAGRAEPKLLCRGKFEHPVSGRGLGAFRGLRISSDGARVAIASVRDLGSMHVEGLDGASDDYHKQKAAVAIALASAASLVAVDEVHVPNPRVYVFSSDTEKVAAFDCGPRRVPMQLCWDALEPRLLGAQASVASLIRPATNTRTLGGAHSVATTGSAASQASTSGLLGAAEGKQGDEGAEPEPMPEVLTVFASTTAMGHRHKALVQQDAVPLDGASMVGAGAQGSGGVFQGQALLALATPYLVYFDAVDPADATASCLSLKTMRDFVGLERSDEATKRAILDFSYHMATGNIDEAYKAVKSVVGPAVWENMAHMCVKTRRMDGG
jgi:hypothetical protein